MEIENKITIKDFCQLYNSSNLGELLFSLNVSKNSFYNFWKKIKENYRIYMVPNIRNLNLILIESKKKIRNYEIISIRSLSSVSLYYTKINEIYGYNLKNAYTIEGVDCFNSFYYAMKKTKKKLSDEEFKILSLATKELMTAKQMENVLKIPWQRIYNIIYNFRKLGFFISLSYEKISEDSLYVRIKLDNDDIVSYHSIIEKFSYRPVGSVLILRSLKDNKLNVVFPIKLDKLIELINYINKGKLNIHFKIENVYYKYSLPPLNFNQQ